MDYLDSIDMRHIYLLVLHSLTGLLLLGVVPLSAQESRITEVLAYHPAPGQFMGSEAMASQDVTTYADLLRKAQQRLVEEHTFLSLGGWGGYIVVRIQPALVNQPDQADFAILGNAFIGNAEPGIIYVSQDVNSNGLADDPWYRIRGSEDYRSNLDYTITYYKPKDPYNDPIAWSDSEGESGFIPRNKYHTTNSYYPLWEGDKVTFTGVLLPDCMKLDPATGQWRSEPYAYGYADNHPNDSSGSHIDINSAVNAAGELVHLDRIDFLKVQTGVHQQTDVTGEVSTEFTGIKPLAKGSSIVSPTATPAVRLSYSDKQLQIESEVSGTLYLYNIDGQLILTHPLSVGRTTVALPAMGACYVALLRLEGGATTSQRICRQ